MTHEQWGYTLAAIDALFAFLTLLWILIVAVPQILNNRREIRRLEARIERLNKQQP